MKHLLSLVFMVLFYCHSVSGQTYFAFNDAIDHKASEVAKFASIESPTFHESIKKLDFTGPFLVNHDQIGHKLEIELTNVFDVLDFEIQDMNGLIIKTIGKKEAKKIFVDLDHLSKGLYVLKLKGGNETFTTKIQHGI